MLVELHSKQVASMIFLQKENQNTAAALLCDSEVFFPSLSWNIRVLHRLARERRQSVYHVVLFDAWQDGKNLVQ